MLGTGDYMTGRILAEACLEVQQRRAEKGICSGRFGTSEGVENMRDVNVGKLAPTWEGPYRVTAIASARAYYLEDLDERPLP